MAIGADERVFVHIRRVLDFFFLRVVCPSRCCFLPLTPPHPYTHTPFGSFHLLLFTCLLILGGQPYESSFILTILSPSTL